MNLVLEPANYIAMTAIVISLIALIRPIWLGRVNLKVKQVRTHVTTGKAAHVIVLLYNASAKPINISGAEVTGGRLYRRQHKFIGDPGAFGSVTTTQLPVVIGSWSESEIYLEFDFEKTVDRGKEQTLTIQTDRKNVKSNFKFADVDIPLDRLLRDL